MLFKDLFSDMLEEEIEEEFSEYFKEQVKADLSEFRAMKQFVDELGNKVKSRNDKS